MKGKFWLYTGTINHEDYPVLGAVVVIVVVGILAVSLALFFQYLPE